MDPLMLQMMQMFMGRSQSYQQNPFGFSGNPANTAQYNPSLVQNLSQYLFPNIGRDAPPTMLQSDYDQMLRASNFRNTLMQQQTATSPMANATARVALTAMYGRDKADNMLNQFNQSAVGKLALNTGFRAMFGPGVEMQRANAAMNMQKFYSGTMYDRGGRRGPVMGMSRGEINETTQRMFDATYTDKAGMNRRNSFFGMTEMSDIAMLSSKYGAVANNPTQLVNQAKSMSGVMQAAMGIYQTLDKEGALQSIMEITRGQVPVSDTNKMSGILYKISSYARTMNVNIKTMQQITAETSKALDMAGLSPTQAVGITGSTLMLSQGMTSGPNPMMSQRDMARFGGASAMRQRMTAQTIGTMRSGAYNNAALIYANADLLDPKNAAAIRAGAMDDFSQGNQPDIGLVQQIEKKKYNQLYRKYRQTGISDEAARRMANSGIRGEMIRARVDANETFTENFMDKKGGIEMQRAISVSQLKDNLRKENIPDSDINKMIAAARNGNKDIQQMLRSTLTTRFVEQGMDQEEARAQALNTVTMATGSKKQMDRFQRQESERRRIALDQQAKEMGRTNRGLMDPFKQMFANASLGGEGFSGLVSAMLGQKADYFMNNFGLVDPSQMSTFNNIGFRDAQTTYNEWFSDPKLSTQYSALTALSGRRGVTREGMFGKKGFFHNMRNALKNVRGGQTFDSVRASVETVFGAKGKFSAADIYEKVKDTDMNFENFADALRKISGKTGEQFSTQKLQRNVGVVNAYMSFLDGIDDLEEGQNDDRGRKILGMSRELINQTMKQDPKFRSEKVWSKEELQEKKDEFMEMLQGMPGFDTMSPKDIQTNFTSYLKKSIGKQLKKTESRNMKYLDISIDSLKQDRKSLYDSTKKSVMKIRNSDKVIKVKRDEVLDKYSTLGGSKKDRLKLLQSTVENIIEGYSTGDEESLRKAASSLGFSDKGKFKGLPSNVSLAQKFGEVITDYERLVRGGMADPVGIGEFEEKATKMPGGSKTGGGGMSGFTKAFTSSTDKLIEALDRNTAALKTQDALTGVATGMMGGGDEKRLVSRLADKKSFKRTQGDAIAEALMQIEGV